MKSAALLLAVVVAIPTGAAAAGRRTGTTVVGTIVNATRGHEVPRNLRVEAAPVAPDGTRGSTRSTTVDEQGRFTFTRLDDAKHYTIATRYEGVIYTTTFEAPDDDAPAVRLAIFETTSSPADLRLNAITTIVDVEGGMLEALEVLRVRNAGDRTYVGDALSPAAVVELPVPDGAFEVRAEEGTPALTARSGRVFSQAPVQPGETRISYSYKLAASDGAWVVGRTLPYAARRADLLVGPGIHLAPGEGLELLGDLDFKGAEYRQYRVERVAAGRTVEVSLVGTAAETGGGRPTILVAGLALAGVVATVTARHLVKKRIPSRRHPRREVP